LVRELLAADAEPALANADGAGRARKCLHVVASGLGVRAGAILVHDVSTDRFQVAATTLPPTAIALLADPAGRCGQLARRAATEHRAFVTRRATDDPLVRALHESDPMIETVAILPFADHGSGSVLVLAGDDITLATDVVRTLNPALRLLGLLLAAQPGGPASDAALAQRLDELQAECTAQAEKITALEAQIADLEGALATARAASPVPMTPGVVAAVVAETARAAEGLVRDAAAEDGSPTPTIVVLDTATAWEAHEITGQRVVVVPPSSTTVAQLRAEPPGRLIVNVAAPGALATLVELRAHGVLGPAIGVAGHGGADRVVGLGVVDAVEHSATADGLIAAVDRAAPRGARVFAAGRDAEALMKMRQGLTKHGLSVSLARDTKQIDELLAMVRPQVIVIDLELPMRQGYELVMRMAATMPIPAMVLILPNGDPAPAMLDKVRDRITAGLGINAKQWLASAATQKLPSKATAKPTGAAAH
jgi:FixJ family two-component response regulator/cell division protein FtsB